MSNIRIYKIGDVDWVAAATIKDAKEIYSSVTENTDDEEPVALTDQEMHRLTFVEDVYNPEESDRKTFKQKLDEMVKSGESFPTMFATSEW